MKNQINNIIFKILFNFLKSKFLSISIIVFWVKFFGGNSSSAKF